MVNVLAYLMDYFLEDLYKKLHNHTFEKRGPNIILVGYYQESSGSIHFEVFDFRIWLHFFPLENHDFKCDTW